MTDTAVSPTFAPRRWLLLILLVAALLRLWALADAPPGLTHDEADHGLTAWSIVQGAREIYFEIGYGREPLYDYATAGVMALLGENYLAGRLTAVAFGLLLIAATYAWVRRAFDTPTALLTAAGLAIGFWPLMTARQMLRSVALPGVFVLAVALVWRRLMVDDLRLKKNHFNHPSIIILSGILLGFTFYTYIPARVLWGVFPATAVYLWLVDRQRARPFTRRVVLLLAVMAVVAAPLLIYLQTHPGLEVRIDELQAPLLAAQSGDWQPLLTNIGGSLKLFTISGDPTWRYNVPGRPFLTPITGVLFYVGLVVAGWWVIRPFHQKNAIASQQGAAAFFALAWLLAGLSPVLVTGPALATTQAIGLQPVLYLFPALALVALGRLGIGDWGLGRVRWMMWLVPVLLFAGIGLETAVAYFHTWANAPEVRVQYEATMAAVVDTLNDVPGGDVAISTITPIAEHTPALVALMLTNEAVTPRYFDGRTSLLIPAGNGRIIFPGFAALPPSLARWFDGDLIDELPMRPTDLDRPVQIYAVDGDALVADWQASFAHVSSGNEIIPTPVGDALIFHGYVVAQQDGMVQMVTWWEAVRPLPHAVLFTHLLGPDGAPTAQQDLLSAPASLWQPGDHFLQLHQFAIPDGLPAGQYPLAVGAYTCLDDPLVCQQTQRLSIQNAIRPSNLILLPPIQIPAADARIPTPNSPRSLRLGGSLCS